ncbi:MAG: PIN domain-containing protein [Gammaproteobacteria bacterium]|nr:PIN domain-containing protein [Gammaproteobacteria bacterium]
MRRVFADAGYWIAMTFRNDSLHEKARAVNLELRKGGSYQLVTSEMVLSELLSHASNKGEEARIAAARAVRAIRRNSTVLVHAQTSELFENALGKYERSGDKSWSLTDCASFVLMQQNEIREALAHDHHFRQAGYRTLL